MSASLEQSIYHTVRYFDLFDQPVTATRIWRSLVVVAPGSKWRWSTERLPQLPEVETALRESSWLRKRLRSQWGYYFLVGREGLVEPALVRHSLAQSKWKVARRASWWLARVPFVRMLAGSGSLAVANTNPSSDLDIFVVAGENRIWTTRLLLLVVSQLLGRRRRHWDRQAPDKLCLNHYVAEGSLTMPTAVRNLYTAMLYTHLVPVYGQATFQQFMVANTRWLKRYLVYPAHPALAPAQAVAVDPVSRYLKRGVEWSLAGVVGTQVERLSERVQRYFIQRHTRAQQTGRVALSRGELAFHPDTKVPRILEQFRREEGQQQLL